MEYPLRDVAKTHGLAEMLYGDALHYMFEEELMNERTYTHDGIIPLDEEAAAPLFGKKVTFRIPVDVMQLIDFIEIQGFQDFLDSALGVVLEEWKIEESRTALNAEPGGGLILYVTGYVSEEN